MDPNPPRDNRNNNSSLHEAYEGHEIIGEEIQPRPEEEGEDIMENMEVDYKPIEKLDEYNMDHLDREEAYSEMDFEQKRRADEQINRRHRREGRVVNNRKLPDFVKDHSDESFFSEGLDASGTLIQQKKEEFYERLGEEEGVEEEEDKYHDLEQIRGRLAEWIKDPKTIRFIKRSFRRFMSTFRDEAGSLVYEKRIYDMCSDNGQSLEVTYLHLSQKSPTLAYWIFETPALIFPYLNTVVFDMACRYFPGFENIQSEVYVKIAEFPLEEKIRDLRVVHLNTLIKIKGVITRRYPVYNSLKKLYMICVKCGGKSGPYFFHDSDKNNLRLPRCVHCQAGGPYKVDKELTVYRNNQKITVQEAPNSVEPGRVPRYKDVVLLGDNIDRARPGDEVEIVGVYTSLFDQSMNAKHGFPIFSTFIEANHVKRVQELLSNEITEADKEEIIRLAKSKDIFGRVVRSIAPSIFGHLHVKKALALALFGGTAVRKETHRVRGDINILMLGDPGLAKSQFLKYIQGVSHRSIYTTGKGATAVGLTASVRRDPVKGEWCLEAGALVLADTGICLIDEFDKMSDQDRTSIHEAMEQQSISISKAGIVASLQARCSVIAAANPVKGSYDNQMSFKDNVNLTDPILSRFDVLCVLKDVVRIDRDAELAEFIVSSHMINHPDSKEDEQSRRLRKNRYEAVDAIPQTLLKKFVLYAKQNYTPSLTRACVKKIELFYVKIRQASVNMSGLDIVPRHLESLIRFSQASAKIHLRPHVELSDCDIAISMLLESFIQSQKPSVGKNIEKQFGLELKKNRNVESLVLHELQELLNSKVALLKLLNRENMETQQNENPVVKIPLQELEERLKQRNLNFELNSFLKKKIFTDKFTVNNGVIERRVYQ